MTLSAHCISFATVEQTVSIASNSFASVAEQPKSSLLAPAEFEVALVDKLLNEKGHLTFKHYNYFAQVLTGPEESTKMNPINLFFFTQLTTEWRILKIPIGFSL
jgi:hypothetical protein